MKATSAATHDLLGDDEPILAPAFRRWLLPLDHAEAAKRHLKLIATFFIVALLVAIILRLELMTPAGDRVSARTFASLFSLHGMLMFYFVLLPAFPGVLGLALLPGMIGARHMAFPRLANTSWHLLAAGGLIVLGTFIVGGTNAGWMFEAAFGGTFDAPHVAASAIGVFLAAVALALLGLNIVATALRHRRPDLAWIDLPPFAMALFLSACIAVVACPLLASCMAMIAADSFFGLALFDPASGADPQLFRSIFWLFGTPALYMILLPALGIVTEIIARSVRREVAGGRVLSRLFLLIAVMGFFMWGQHFHTGEAERTSGWVASVMTGGMLAAVGAVVVFWLATLYRGSVLVDTPMVYALGFIVTLVVGALSGAMMAVPPMNVFLHGTTFVTAHVHIMAAAALGMAFMGGLHLAYANWSSRPAADALGCAAAVVVVVGVYLTFLPLFIMGAGGLVRRSHAYPPEFQVLQVLSAAGATILCAGIVMACVNLLRRGSESQVPPLAAATAER